MKQLLFGWGLQLLFAMFVISVGYRWVGVCIRQFKLPDLKWLERIAFGAMIIVLVFFVGGVVVAIVPWEWRRIIGLLILASIFFSSLNALINGAWREMCLAPRSQKLVAAATLVLAMLALSISWLPVRIPEVLIDGPYVVKQDLPVVRVQHISGTLPIDNALPHVASEYLLRGISFGDERPLMPGQEVSNRPVMVSFVLLPWRTLLPLPIRQTEPLPRFSYVGQSWPDFSVFLQDKNAWAISVAIGSVLNAMLILAVGAWLVCRKNVSDAAVYAFILLAISSPYILIQTFFTWPKALAGYFVMLSYLSVKRGLSPGIVGLSLGLAYWSHPFAVVYAAAFAAWLTWRGFISHGMRAIVNRQVIIYCFSLIIVVAPWFIWMKLVLHIPSDLVTQNLLLPGQSGIDFLWIRLLNLFNTFLPVYFQQYPYDANGVLRSSSVNMAGAIGLFPMAFLLHRLISHGDLFKSDVLLPWILPCVLLVAVFSGPAIPAVHGLQPVVMFGLAVAVVHFFSFAQSRLVWSIIIIQVALNALLFGRYLRGLL